MTEKWREGVERAKRMVLKSMEICERGKEGRIEGGEAVITYIVKRKDIMMERNDEMR